MPFKQITRKSTRSAGVVHRAARRPARPSGLSTAAKRQPASTAPSSKRRFSAAAAAFIVCVSAVAFAAHPASAQTPPTPVSLVEDHCDDISNPGGAREVKNAIWKCLPAWRWTGLNGGGELVSTGADWGKFSITSKLLNNLFGAVRSLPFLIAKTVWWGTMQILKLAVDPALIPDLYSKLQGELEDTWTQLFEFLGVPGSASKSLLWISLLAVTVFYSVWLIVKPRTNAFRWQEINDWSTGAIRLAGTVIPLVLLVLMLTSITSPDDVQSRLFTPTSIMTEPTKLVDKVVLTPLTTAANELVPNESIEDSHLCDKYRNELVDTFRKAYSAELGLKHTSTYDPEKDETIHEYAPRTSIPIDDPAAAIDSSGGLIELPVMISGMWEGAYLAPLGSAQFRDADTANRAMCFLLEFNGKRSAERQRNVIYKALGVSTASQGTPEWASQADDMFNPALGQGNEQRALLVLASACEFPEGKDPDVVKEWRYIENEKELDGEICKAWMFPDKVDPDVFKPSLAAKGWHTVKGWFTKQAVLRNAVGVQAPWILEAAAIDSGDVARWVSTIKSGSLPPPPAPPPPSVEDTETVSQVLDAIEGSALGFAGFGYSIWAVIVAWFYAKALGGLAVGLLVAQLVLATIIFTLPLLLFIIALPVKAAETFRKKLIRLYLATLLSYTLFYTLMMVLVLLTNVILLWLEALFGTGTFLHGLAAGIAPLLALWVLGKGLKMFGMGGVMSLKGAAQLSSGLSAAGMKLPDVREFASKARSTSSKWVTRGAKASRPVQLGFKSGIRGAKAARQAKATGKSQLKAAAGSIGADFKTATVQRAKDFKRWAGDDLEKRSKFKTTPWTKAGNDRRAIEKAEAKLRKEEKLLFGSGGGNLHTANGNGDPTKGSLGDKEAEQQSEKSEQEREIERELAEADRKEQRILKRQARRQRFRQTWKDTLKKAGSAASAVGAAAKATPGAIKDSWKHAKRQTGRGLRATVNGAKATGSYIGSGWNATVNGIKATPEVLKDSWEVAKRQTGRGLKATGNAAKATGSYISTASKATVNGIKATPEVLRKSREVAKRQGSRGLRATVNGIKATPEVLKDSWEVAKRQTGRGLRATGNAVKATGSYISTASKATATKTTETTRQLHEQARRQVQQRTQARDKKEQEQLEQLKRKKEKLHEELTELKNQPRQKSRTDGDPSPITTLLQEFSGSAAPPQPVLYDAHGRPLASSNGSANSGSADSYSAGRPLASGSGSAAPPQARQNSGSANSGSAAPPQPVLYDAHGRPLGQAHQNNGNSRGVNAELLAGIIHGFDMALQRQDFRVRQRAHEARKKSMGYKPSRKRKAATVKPRRVKVPSGGGADRSPDDTWDDDSGD